MSEALLITSAAYIGQELAAEFGRIPPAFLPIGTSRLYEAQISQFGGEGSIYLTIPESFKPDAFDDRRLRELGVVLLRIPEELRLGESIVYALNYIGGVFAPIKILHGDTLVENKPLPSLDTIAIHDEGDDYSWAAVDVLDGLVVDLEVIAAGAGHDQARPVACGYFAFEDSSLLIRSITRARGDFIAGLRLYAKDRALTALRVQHWRDFGHIQTYFRSRRLINTARSFNRLQINEVAVTKFSDDDAKISAEAAWFKAVPSRVQPYCARIFDSGFDEAGEFYSIEYQYAPTLSELFVFSSIGRPTWSNIMRSCRDFLAACATCTGTGEGGPALAELAVAKTSMRLERYARESGFSIEAPNRLDGRPMPSLRRIAEEVAGLIDLSSGRRETVMHGDFCFSNILYNSRSARIAVIDPRGYVTADAPSCYGDLRYDLAKFSHSIVGCYDFIMAGRYDLARSDAHSFVLQVETSLHRAWLQQTLADMEVGGLKPNALEIRALTVGLFLSMLPLHADRPDRQAAFIATALTLFSGFERLSP